MRTRMSGGVAGESGIRSPYADCGVKSGAIFEQSRELLALRASFLTSSNRENLHQKRNHDLRFSLCCKGRAVYSLSDQNQLCSLSINSIKARYLHLTQCSN